MDKEEVLKASRDENNERDLAEIEVENKAFKMASIWIILLTTFYFFLEIILKGETNYGWYSILGLDSAIVYGYKAVNNKKRIYIFLTITWGLITIITATKNILSVISTSQIL